jgi:UDP-N-acetylglucosamine 2-epimerase
MENTVKLVTFNNKLNLNEHNDKNRIFVTGNTIMSAKLSTSEAARNRVCD